MAVKSARKLAEWAALHNSKRLTFAVPVVTGLGPMIPIGEAKPRHPKQDGRDKSGHD
jgi:hypothetical protein